MNPADMTLEELASLQGYILKNRRLTSAEAAALMGIRPNTLEVKRVQKTGPRFFRPENSRRIYYVERDVLEFLARGSFHHSTSEYVTSPPKRQGDAPAQPRPWERAPA
jgi:hypothetical protein